MENNNEKTGNTNWTPPTSTTGIGQDLPGASASQICGIIGLILTLCTGCGIVGFILSIVAFVKGKNAIKEYEVNATGYSESSYKQAKTGKILGIIGIILGGLAILTVIGYLLIMGVAGFTGYQFNNH